MSGNTVLIVDDEPSARETLEALLYRDGYDLRFAENGIVALENLDEISPDVILLDVMMPGLNGFKVCQAIKSDPEWQHIPVILVTALDNKQDIALGLEVGAEDFLTKPVNGLELRSRVRSMLRIKKQFDEIQEMLSMREDLSNMLMHDMRNALMPIMGYSHLLLETSDLNGADREGMATIYKQSQVLNAYMNDLLIIAKMETGKLIVNRTMVDGNEFVTSVVRSYQMLAGINGIKLHARVPKNSKHVFIDQNLFRRLIDNLLSNALKFSPEGTTITLQLTYLPGANQPEPDQPSMRIRVADQGPGVAAEDRERIFQKYETGKVEGNKKVNQIGLGLAFCKMVTDAHIGQIFVTENQPQGAVFVVEV